MSRLDALAAQIHDFGTKVVRHEQAAGDLHDGAERDTAYASTAASEARMLREAALLEYFTENERLRAATKSGPHAVVIAIGEGGFGGSNR